MTPRKTTTAIGGETAHRSSAYEKIRDAVISGELAPGQQLSESSLAAWCGLSRTPIREAIFRLEQDGLLVWNENGLVVRSMTPEEVLDYYDLRAYLEAASARTAAERRSDRDMRMLRITLEAGDKVDSAAVPEMVAYSRGFMDLVLRVSRSTALIDALSRVKLQLLSTVTQNPTVNEPGRWEATRTFQSALVERIAERDRDGAYDLTLAHFFAARDVRMEMISRGDFA